MYHVSAQSVDERMINVHYYYYYYYMKGWVFPFLVSHLHLVVEQSECWYMCDHFSAAV